MDFGKGTLVPYANLLEEMLALVREDADALGCAGEVARARTIAATGTSADRQLAVYRRMIDANATPEAAIRAVVDHLVAETVEDL